MLTGCGDAVAGVAVLPGFDFTNVVIKVEGASGAQVSLVDSANAPVSLDAPLVPASAYAYDVRLDGASIASGAFATGSDEAPVVCGQTTVVDISQMERAVRFPFAASPSNRVTCTDLTFDIDGYRAAESLDSLYDDAPVTAIAAVTNSAGVPGWRAWNGSWVSLDGPAPRVGTQYTVRTVIDFRHNAPRTCYLISEDGGETYVVLHHNGDAWLESPSSVDRLSVVDAIGDVLDVTHRAIDGTATVRYTGEGGEETTGSLADALAATPSDGSGAAITLLTNVTWPEGGPQSGEYLIDKGGYSLANVPDGVGVVVDASDLLEFLCNPNMVRWQNTTYYYRLGPLHFFNGLIYTSGGDVNGNVGPCPIWAVDPVSGAFVDEYDAASEQLGWFAEDSAGRLYTPYYDIREGYPEQAIFARRGLDGKWEPMQVWPDIRGQYEDEEGNDRIEGYAVHTYEVAAWKGRIFTGGLGITWGWEGSDSVMSNASVFIKQAYSFPRFIPFENDLFCTCNYPYRMFNCETNDTYRFDEATGQFVVMPHDESSELSPAPAGYSETVSGYHYYKRYVSSVPFRFKGRTLYRGGFNYLYNAVAEDHRIRAELIDSVGPIMAVVPKGDSVAVLKRQQIYDNTGKWRWRFAVLESSDGFQFSMRFVFYLGFGDYSAVIPFAYHDGCYYLGFSSGDIYRIRDQALADLPAVEAEGAVVVQEGGRGVVRFRLSKRPSAAITAPVRAALGVPALRPDVAEVVFTPENWNEWHEVAFAADDDRIDIVKPGAIVCGGADSGCTWGAARVEVENNDFRVAETPPEGLVDLTRPDGDFTVTTHLRTERDWPGLVTQMKNPFNDDTTLTNTQQRLWVKSRPACDVDYDFGEPTVVNAYGIYLTASAYANAESSSYAPPRMWTFSGSNDGVHWRVLDRRSCETGWTSREYRYYSFRNRRAYRKYRISFDSDGNTCAAYTQLSHLEYYNVPRKDDDPGLFIRIE